MNSCRKRIAIVQPNYIPWKGYFDLMRSVDHFVLLDCVQYTDRDWRNRNRIKTRDGVAWLTIPVRRVGRTSQPICDVTISHLDWRDDHLRRIREHYRRADYFGNYFDWLEQVYHEASSERLACVCEVMLRLIGNELKISTPISRSSSMRLQADGPTERLVEICSRFNATGYLSGPAARDYIDEAQFQQAGITLEYFAYDGYITYEQLYPPFTHSVSIIDAILNLGDDARSVFRRLSSADHDAENGRDANG